MIERIVETYNSGVDRFMLSLGYLQEPEVLRAFGGVPQLNHAGRVDPFSTSVLNGHRYVYLGPYKVPYKKIKAAKQKGEAKVVLAGDDFRGGASLFNFGELERLQQEAQTRGEDCLVKDLELVFDYVSIFPKNFTIQGSH